jgi:DNA-damage-inducible protein J
MQYNIIAYVLNLCYNCNINLHWRIQMITLQTRVNEDLKVRAESLFKDMGMTTTEAIRLFLTQCVNHGKLPFQPVGKQPNKYTLEALREDGGTSYKNVEDLADLWK